MTAMTPKQLLSAKCPHGNELGNCQDLWCRSRTEDLLDGEYQPNLPELPERTQHASQP